MSLDLNPQHKIQIWSTMLIKVQFVRGLLEVFIIYKVNFSLNVTCVMHTPSLIQIQKT